jgi:hypothetical protein
MALWKLFSPVVSSGGAEFSLTSGEAEVDSECLPGILKIEKGPSRLRWSFGGPLHEKEMR